MKDTQSDTAVMKDTAVMNSPAPLGARIRSQALFELRSIVSNGEQLFLCFALPIGALVVLALTEILTVLGYQDAQRAQVATAAGLGLSIAASAFTGQAIATGFDRRYGVLRQLATTPLGKTGLILSKILAVYCVTAVQFVLTLVVAEVLRVASPGSSALTTSPLTGAPGQVAGLVLAWLFGTAALVALALALAGTLRAEAVLALSNILWVVGASVSGLVLQHPGVWGKLASLTPFGALGDTLRAALTQGNVDLSALVVLAVWAVVGILAGATWFSFESK